MKMTEIFENKTHRPTDRLVTEALSVEGINDHSCDKVIKRCLVEVARFHVAHWKTNSYAEHMAIGGFYEKLTELTDSIAEKFISLGGYIDGGVSASFSTETNPDTIKYHLSEFRNVIGHAIEETGEDSNLLAINDDLIQVQSLIDSTIYKLDLV